VHVGVDDDAGLVVDAETRGGDCQLVLAWLDEPEGVDAGVVGGDGLRKVGADVGQRDAGSRNDGASGIGDLAG